MDRLPRYRTGDPGLDRAVAELVELSEPGDQGDLVFEIVVSAIRMGREGVDRADLKLVNAALKEIRYAFHVFEPYQRCRKCTIFGSARTRPDDPTYRAPRARRGHGRR